MVANIENWGVTHVNRRWLEYIGAAAAFTTRMPAHAEPIGWAHANVVDLVSRAVDASCLSDGLRRQARAAVEDRLRLNREIALDDARAARVAKISSDFYYARKQNPACVCDEFDPDSSWLCLK